MIDQPGLRQVESLWQVPTLQPELSPSQVHVWRVQLDALLPHLAHLSQCLSPEEQDRADRLRFEHLRSRFIISRAALRHLVSAYLNIPAGQLVLGYQARGKPYLLGEHLLSFNLSHSDNLAVYSFAWQPFLGIDFLGIDIEQVRALDVLAIADRYFSPAEASTLRTLPPEQQQTAFFRYWTGKEAYLKAIGTGLADSLSQIEMTLTPTHSAQLVKLNGDEQLAKLWSLQEFVPASGYVGTIALLAKTWQLKFWEGTALISLLQSYPC